MNVAKVTEISAQSPKSFEHAVQTGLERAAKTLKNIRSAWVKDQQVDVKDNKVSMYRVSMKVTFVLE